MNTTPTEGSLSPSAILTVLEKGARHAEQRIEAAALRRVWDEIKYMVPSTEVLRLGQVFLDKGVPTWSTDPMVQLVAQLTAKVEEGVTALCVDGVEPVRLTPWSPRAGEHGVEMPIPCGVAARIEQRRES